MSKTKADQMVLSASSSKASSESRKLQPPTRVWSKPQTWTNRKPILTHKPLPKARSLFATLFRQLWAHKFLFGVIVLIYGVASLLLVASIASGGDVSGLRDILRGTDASFWSDVQSSLNTFVVLVGTSSNGNSAASSVYQGVLLIVCSLAFIWALRQVIAHNVIRVRDSFYKGMYPLIPFMLVLVLIALQLLPLIIGGNLFAAVTSRGIAIHLWEKTIWLLLLLGLAFWSLRMVTAGIFALYITTLPDMTPLRAYRSARLLVYGRRLMIWRKLVFMMVVLLLAISVVVVPFIALAPGLAAWVFFVLSILLLPIVHGYLYNLYREML